MIKRIGIIGLGNVGEAVIRSFKKYKPLIARRISLRVEISKVCDSNKSKARLAGKLSVPFVSDPFKLIDDPRLDIVVELIGGIEPAYTLISEALKRGKHVVTANKALLAERGSDIFSLAKRKKRRIGFEASVCGAIPLIKSVSEGLIGCEVKKIYGILNGTTNFILDKMAKEKIDFSSSLTLARRIGLAERRPSLDIKGTDTLHKLCILSYLCYGIWPQPARVYAQGISKISLLDVVYAEELNYRIKLLAIAKKEKGVLDLRVHPALVSLEHPLSQVSLAYNGVYLHTQPAGEMLFYGEGAGGIPTSSSVISDIVSIASGGGVGLRRQERISLQNMRKVKTRYYIRFMAFDRPGVLAKISKILASLNISISSVTQKERKRGKIVPIVMLTHEAKEDSVRKALERIDKLPVIKSPSQIIRIEDL
jgi:homoserine dehydrogenase